jgi:hypothetical protein
MERTDQTSSPYVRRAVEEARRRPWAVTVIGLLLLVQAASLLGIGALDLAAAYLSNLPTAVSALAKLLSGAASSAGLGAIFVFLSILAVLAAVGFLRLRRIAWTTAMLVQGLALFVALVLYFRGKSWYAYILMLYGILMVLYMNTYDVRMAFRPWLRIGDRDEGRQESERRGGER